MSANPSGTGIAACDYSGTSFSVNVNLTDGKTHQVALYLLDWDGGGARSETVTVEDASTGAVLNSQLVSNFSQGARLVWNISGNVRIVVSDVSGVNAVAGGIFFGSSSRIRARVTDNVRGFNDLLETRSCK